jgi:pimeloyl-ACP methyl ester carboxylesterase
MDKYFKYADIQCKYSDTGEGEAVLFVHGFAEDGTVWERFKQPFTAGYRVLVLDLPGVGGSGMPATGFTMDMLADNLFALLKDAGVDKVHFVGHSMGGYAAMAFAQKHAGMLLSLTMFHSQPFADSEEKKAGRLKQADFVAKNGTSLFVRELYYNLFSESFAKNNTAFMEGRIAAASTIPASSIIAALKGMAARLDKAEVLKTISVPVLFIIGKEDKAIPHDNSMKQTHLPDRAEVHLLDGVGHMGMFEKEAECRAILKGFIKSATQ